MPNLRGGFESNGILPQREAVDSYGHYKPPCVETYEKEIKWVPGLRPKLNLRARPRTRLKPADGRRLCAQPRRGVVGAARGFSLRNLPYEVSRDRQGASQAEGWRFIHIPGLTEWRSSR